MRTEGANKTSAARIEARATGGTCLKSLKKLSRPRREGGGLSITVPPRSLGRRVVAPAAGDRRVAGVAKEVTGDERDRLYAEQAALYPQFAEYEQKTTRRIPVVVVTPES